MAKAILTVTDVKEECKKLAIRCRWNSEFQEFKIGNTESEAYFTTDYQDAIDTARAMSAHKAGDWASTAKASVEAAGFKIPSGVNTFQKKGSPFAFEFNFDRVLVWVNGKQIDDITSLRDFNLVLPFITR